LFQSLEKFLRFFEKVSKKPLPARGEPAFTSSSNLAGTESVLERKGGFKLSSVDEAKHIKFTHLQS
jgi:hypothetical protein